jgi:hypothetical protein
MNSVGWIEWSAILVVRNPSCTMSSTFNVFRSAPFPFDLLLCLGLFGKYNTEEGSTNAEPSAPSLDTEPSHYMED